MFLKIIIFNILILIFIRATNAKKELFCMHEPNTALNRNGDSRFTLENIDPSLCTHLVYLYFGITDAGELVSKHPLIDNYRGNIMKFKNLKRKNENLKILIAIGGWENESSVKYSSVAEDPIKRQNFIRSTLAFIRRYKFDGIALHWCFPGVFGGDPIYDKINFSIWLKEIKEAFNKDKFILMAMVQGIIDNSDLSYEINKISDNVDYIFLTTYDLYGIWRTNIGLHSGLYKAPGVNEDFLNVNFMVKDWIRGGANPKKLIMGIPFFGRTFTLANKNQIQPGAKFIGPGKDGEIMNYMTLCKKIQKENWNMKWEPTVMGPFMHKDDQWVSYDNIKSIEIKVDYIMKNSLGGAAGIFIEDDDYRNNCGNGSYPLLKALKNALDIEPKEKSQFAVKIQLIKKNKISKLSENLVEREDRFEL